jgi:hypothetical protein
MAAGSQGGKTSFGPWWLKREIYDIRGPGDYIAATASFDLFKLKMLPTMLEVFENIFKCGRYWAADRVIELAEPINGEFLAKRATDRMWGRIILRSADALSGLESATAKGAWLDEAGQERFLYDAYKAIRRRIALYKGRSLITTTLYTVGWLTEMMDAAITTGNTRYEQSGDSDIDVTESERTGTTLVQFDSILNPLFSKEEFYEQREIMPDEEFQMFFRGRKGSRRMLIYNNFADEDIINPFSIPDEWKRYIGLDFGPVHMCAMYYAEEPMTKTLYCYREYLGANRTTKEFANEILYGEMGIPICYGGAKNEDQWRTDLADGGLPVIRPLIDDVDIGINRVYAQHSKHGIMYFNNVKGIIDQKRKYRRKRDKSGEITGDIENKSSYHFLDAERYIISSIRTGDTSRIKIIRLGDQEKWQQL